MYTTTPKILYAAIAALLVSGACRDNGSGEAQVFPDDCPVVAEQAITPDGDTVIVCNMSLVRDTFNLPLSALVSGFEIINLEEEHEDAWVKTGGNVAVSSRYAGIYSSADQGGYRLFDRSGKYIATLASRGQGPGEYTLSVYDSYIDEANARVYLLPMMSSKMLVCDMQGKVVQVIPLAYHVPKGRFRVNTGDGTLLVAALPFENTPAVVWKQDFQGNIIQEVPSGHLAVSPSDYSNEADASQNTGGMDFSIFHWVARNDTLYHYDELRNRLKPVFTARFDGDNIRRHDYKELPGHYLVRLIDTSFSHYPFVLVDKKSLRGSYVRLLTDSLGNIPGPAWVDFNRGYYIAGMYAHELKMQLEDALSLPAGLSAAVRDNLRILNGSLDEDDNCVFFVGKLKQEATSAVWPAKAGPAPDARRAPAPAPSTGDDDDRIYRFADLREVKNMPVLKDEDYFRKNSRFADRNPDDRKKVIIGCMVEKDGTTSHLEVAKSSGNTEMDNEALRLVKEAAMLPGTNLKGQLIRCGDMNISVYFPPLRAGETGDNQW